MSTKLFLLINLKLLKITYSFLLNIAKHENFTANKYENANISISRETFIGEALLMSTHNIQCMYVVGAH